MNILTRAGLKKLLMKLQNQLPPAIEQFVYQDPTMSGYYETGITGLTELTVTKPGWYHVEAMMTTLSAYSGHVIFGVDVINPQESPITNATMYQTDLNNVVDSNIMRIDKIFRCEKGQKICTFMKLGGSDQSLCINSPTIIATLIGNI